jgi:tRNA pseudouridine38-40 synthase
MDDISGARPEGRRPVALLLEYDGTAYCGSQYQDNGPTVQSELEGAAARLTGEQSRVAFAGRTDAGVHALGQVAALQAPSRLTACEVMHGLNHHLPADIVVLAAQEAAPDFDPRRDATRRTYRYLIVNRAARLAVERHRAWHVPRRLDVAAMQHAARRLEGAHDFAAFSAPFEGTTARTLRRCDVTADGDRVAIEMEAQAFLPHQVRRTAGPLVEVGLGRMTEDDLATLLARAEPSSAGPAAPACGLYLAHVEYDGFAFARQDGRGT